MQAVQQSPAMLGLSPAAIAIGEAASTSSSPALESAAVSPQPPPSSEIQRLSLDTIRRISAEQAISDLASIVKELVDNALDAEATTIKIRLFQQGLHIIEVSDDGCGISPSSLPFIATRHATSKISSIDDIYSGTGLTMGFRGEALFSMACVSKELVVATRTEDEELATKMVFGKDGLPLNDQTEHFSRKVGTTVAVVNPYSSLPARLADLTRRIRNERTKIYKLIEAYGIFNVGVSFQLIDIGDVNGVGTKTILQTSTTSETLKETVSHLLTPSVLRTMAEVEISLDSILERIYGENSFQWGIKGLLSQEPATQVGSQQQQTSSTRKFENRIVQLYSINGRVVDLPKVTELLQKLWKAFGGKKKPKIILSLTLPNEAFDINLSPDKQTVLLTHEKEILAVVEEFVTNTWSSSASRVFGVSQALKTQNENESKENGHTEPDVDEGSDEEDDGYRQMHKRRFAFVNDLANAKMQHDMDERQIQDEASNRESSKSIPTVDRCEFDATRAASSDKMNTSVSRLEDSPSKKAKASPTHSNDGDVEMAMLRQEPEASQAEFSVRKQGDLATQELTISDTDRRQWIEIQTKFRRSTGSDTDENMIIQECSEVTNKSNIEMVEASNQISPEKIQEPSADRRYHPESSFANDIKTTDETMQRHAASTSKQLRLTDLKLFAFQANGSGPTDGRKRKRRETDPNDSIQPTSVSTVLADDRKRQVSLELSSSSPEVVLDATFDQALDDKPREESSDNDSQQSNVHHNTGDDPGEDTDSNDISQQIVWPSFYSTQQVCRSARMERLNMIERKRDLDNARRMVTANSQMLTVKGENNRKHRGQGETDIESGNDENGGNDQPASSVRMSKSTFRDGMQVIGQFNLGFILAKCSQNQLWILDQHACDEKYNFEHLCKKTIIHEQPLIRPLPLELSPAEEACILDHMDIFKANGFRFNFDAEAPIRRRLSLKALPHSGAVDGQKAVQFGPSDVSSLCSILMEGASYDPGDGGTGVDGSGIYGNNAVRRHASSASRISQSHQGVQTESNKTGRESADTILARLPKAIAMFASRACRTSIMIGTALSHREMNKVVQKLAELDMPFTCAHGRPTMNHVGDLSSVLLQDERRAAEHIATPTITMVPLSQPTDDE